MDSLATFRNVNPGHDRPEAASLSRALGWFSIGLGVAELVAPRLIATLIGVTPHRGTRALVRLVGLRGVTAGLGILLSPRRPLPHWSRVAGDALDLAMLGVASSGSEGRAPRTLAALGAVAGFAALDIYASQLVTRSQDAASSPVVFSVTINKSPHAVYTFFRRLENLPLFMDYLESVEQTSESASRWTARLPLAGSVSWDAELIEDVPGERLAWRTVGSHLVQHRGTVTFARTPGGLATEVRVTMELGAAGIPPSVSLARWLTKPQMKGDLRRLKQVLETGEVLFSDASTHRGPHPAQPSLDGTKHARERSAESRYAAIGEVVS